MSRTMATVFVFVRCNDRLQFILHGLDLLLVIVTTLQTVVLLGSGSVQPPAVVWPFCTFVGGSLVAFIKGVSGSPPPIAL